MHTPHSKTHQKAPHDNVVSIAGTRWHAQLRLIPFVVTDRDSKGDIHIYDTLPDPGAFAHAIRKAYDLPGSVSIVVSGALLRYYDLTTMTEPDIEELRDNLAECGINGEQATVEHLPDRCAFRIGNSSVVARFIPVVFLQKQNASAGVPDPAPDVQDNIQHNIFLQYWQPDASLVINASNYAMNIAEAISSSESDTLSAILSTVEHELSSIDRRVKQATLERQESGNNEHSVLLRVTWEDADDGSNQGSISVPLPFAGTLPESAKSLVQNCQTRSGFQAELGLGGDISDGLPLRH